MSCFLIHKELLRYLDEEALKEIGKGEVISFLFRVARFSYLFGQISGLRNRFLMVLILNQQTPRDTDFNCGEMVFT